ncbi:MAG: glycoside hydrolase family 3 C-terminal domain-containing protein [Arachnia sp.]
MTGELTALEKAALLSGKSVWESRDLPRHGIGSVNMSDGPHGVRKQVGSGDHLGLNASEPATCFPTAATVANSWDAQLAEEVGVALGIEAAALGVDVLLGPGLNIKRSPLAGRNFEYFSEDPYLSGKLAAGYVRGIQSTGTAATPKHFAVNNQELRRMASDSVVDERTLREIYLTGFEIVVREATPRVIMTSYNRVNGVYAHENRHLLTEILREEWGFDGLVVTDWGGGNDAAAAITAGGTIEMPAPGLDSARQIVAAHERGEVSSADLDARAQEAITLAASKRSEPAPKADHDAHHRLARRAAAESVVLLRNEASILPLPKRTKVAIIGDMAQTPRYQGAGSSVVNPTRLSTAVEVLGSSDVDVVGYEQGYRRNSDRDMTLVYSAVELAKRAEVVLLFLGLDEVSESEGVDRDDIDLPDAQLSLLRAVARVNPNVVVVLSAGSVVDTSWARQTQALVHGYLGGQAGAEAIADVLTGAVNPSGKLTETYPATLSDTPTAGIFPGRGRHSLYREGPFVGYRYYDSADVAVRYPFGFGLSYTSFDYSNLQVSSEAVSFTITNSGDTAGAEIAQLYVAQPGSTILRPIKELKGFTKVFLEPGESQQVEIAFDRYTWRHFDVVSNTWQVEGGIRDLLVGASSTDIRLTGTFEVQGVIASSPYDIDVMRAALLCGATDERFAELLGRDVPVEDDDAPLGRNDPLGDMRRAPNPVARLAHRILHWLLHRSLAKGNPDLNLLFLYNMPFRALGKMTNGAVSSEMVDGIVDFVNGRAFRGLRTIIGGFFRNSKANKKTSEALR